jgi:hypothetical protein
MQSAVAPSVFAAKIISINQDSQLKTLKIKTLPGPFLDKTKKSSYAGFHLTSREPNGS